MSGPPGVTRRQALAVLAAGSITATAGCGALTSDDGSDGGNDPAGQSGESEPASTDNGSDGGTGTESGAGEDGDGADESVGVSTWEPAAVGDRSVRLRGALTDLAADEDVTCYFQYRPAGGDWAVTAGQIRSVPGEFAQGLPGLTPATVYEFRAVGNAGDASALGETRSFRTRAARDRSPLSTDGLTLFFDEGRTGREAVAEVPVENTGSSTVGRLTLAVTWYDDATEVLGTTTDRLHVLRPGETWLAQVTPREVDSAAVTSITAETTIEGEAPRGPAGLSVASSSLHAEEYPTELRGVVANTHSEDGGSVGPIARVFDEAGRIVGDSRTYAYDVPSGGQRRFVASFFRRTARRIRENFEHEVVLDRASR